MKKTAIRILCILISAVLLCGSLAACSGASEIPDGYQHATCDGEYFRLFVPTSWSVNTSGGVSSAYVSSRTDTMVSMVELGKAAEGETLADFVEAHMEDIKTLKEYTFVSEQTNTMAGRAAKDITYTVKVGDVKYRIRQVLGLVEGRFYLFTYSSQEDAFERWEDDVEGILDVLEFWNFPYEGEHERRIPDDVTPPKGMKLVSTNAVSYRFYAPTAWIVDKSAENDVVYFSEDDRSNVSLVAHMPESDTLSLEDYWKTCDNYYKDTLGSYELLTSPSGEAGKMGGRDALTYEYTFTVGGVTYKTRQTIAAYASMVYVMTYTAVAENYDAHLDDVTAMQESFAFRTPFGG